MFLEEVREELVFYYGRFYKNLGSIINENVDFFVCLNIVSLVFVLGYLMLEVDFMYFKVIKVSVLKFCYWMVFYYSEFEKNNFEG